MLETRVKIDKRHPFSLFIRVQLYSYYNTYLYILVHGYFTGYRKEPVTGYTVTD